MIVHSIQFGELTVAKEQVLNFPEGLPGFPEERAFALLPYGNDSPFAILQSINEPQLTFILAETFLFFPEYSFEFDDCLAVEYGFAEDNLPQVFSLLTIGETLEKTTANLAAPLVINWQKRIAVQVVLEGNTYTTRHSLFSGVSPERAGGGEK